MVYFCLLHYTESIAQAERNMNFYMEVFSMRNRLLAVLLVLVIVLLSGCSTTSANEDAAADTGAATEDTAPAQDTADEAEGATGAKLTFLGHASCKLVTSAGTVVYIDPAYSQGDYTEEADIVLVTHGHSDHNVVSLVAQKGDCQVITHKEALVEGVYNSYTIKDVTIDAVAAGGNANHSIRDCVGYVLSFDGISLYHAGDTSYIEQMDSLAERNIDYAMYPVDGVYNMGPEEAMQVADTVGARFSIPIHPDYPGSKKFEEFNPEGVLRMEYGQTIDLLAR